MKKNHQNVVYIAGMHRSGTSLVARLLNLCGVYLGPEEELLLPSPENPEGFWESKEFVRLNEGILKALGCDWDYLPQLPENWETSQEILPFIEKAQKLVEKFERYPVWGWKDPRNSLTVPFWKRILPDLKVVICLRNPMEVAHSLSKRGSLSHTFALNLWQTYHRQLLATLQDHEYIVTHYRSYLIDPVSELQRMLAFLDLAPADEAIRDACKTIQPKLAHHSVPIRDLFAANTNPEIIIDVFRTYSKLCSLAGPVYRDLETRERNEAMDFFLQNVVLDKFVLQQNLRQSELTLEDIYQSRGWKLIQVMRRIQAFFISPSS